MALSSFLNNSHPNKLTTAHCYTIPYCGTLNSSNASINNYQSAEENWAFIDMQNLYKGVQERGWKIQWPAFRNYLRNKYGVVKAVVFMGYVSEYKALYYRLRKAGFILEFRPVKLLSNGMIDGGNVDADLASYALDYKQEYNQAIVIADDGDYFKTIMSLNRQNKLKLIISSHLIKHTSELIRTAVCPTQLLSIHSLRNQIG